jgi:hypothetical protein
MWKSAKNIDERRMRAGRKGAFVLDPTSAGLPTWAFLLDLLAVSSIQNWGINGVFRSSVASVAMNTVQIL